VQAEHHRQERRHERPGEQHQAVELRDVGHRPETRRAIAGSTY
jgi:hypothetical protein